MRISEAAAECGLSIDTIRFYEKSGLLPAIGRGGDGRRCFTAKDLDWLTLLAALRETGMPVQQMRSFAALYQQGIATIPDRRAVLLAHAEALNDRRRALDDCAALLRKKLDLYDEIEGKTE